LLGVGQEEKNIGTVVDLDEGEGEPDLARTGVAERESVEDQEALVCCHAEAGLILVESQVLDRLRFH
jgi:hypothetical protein